MDNRDLLKQYVDLGQAIGRYQFERLPDNLKVTYLRKRIIAAETDDDYKLNRYELLGAPKSYKSEMIKHMFRNINQFYQDNTYDDDDGGRFNFIHGGINPVIANLLKSGESDPRIDDLIISFTQDANFIKFLNVSSMNRILSISVNPDKIFANFGSKGEEFKQFKMKNLPKISDDIIYSNNPLSLMDFFGRDYWLNHFKEMDVKDKTYTLSNAKNPKAMLPILGYDIIDYIKGLIQDRTIGHLIHHLLNNANNPQDMEDIFNKYGIEHAHVDKYYSRNDG